MAPKRLLNLAGATAIAALVAFGSSTVPAEAAGNSLGTKPNDVDAIQQLIERQIDLSNNPSTAALSLENRIEIGAKAHRPDSSYAVGQLPFYFATNSVPVVKGAEAYVRASELEYQAYVDAGYKFDIQLGEMQIYQDGKLAVVLATPRGVISAPDGQIMGGSPARWTVALEKASDGNWYIFHEHLSFFVDDGRSPDARLRDLEASVTK